MIPELSFDDAAKGVNAILYIKDIVNSFLAKKINIKMPHLTGRWQNIDGFHYHLYGEIFFQYQGGCQFRFPEEKIELYPGDALIVPVGMPHSETANNFDGKSFNNLVLMCEKAASRMHLAFANRKSRKPQVYYHVKLRNGEFYMHLISALAEYSDRSHGNCDLVRQEILRAIVQSLQLELEDYKHADELRDNHFLASQAMQFINDHFPTHFPEVREIARVVGCSPNYLSGIFHRAFGKTIKDYINSKRLDYAHAMLQNSNFRVSEIAGSCGFTDLSYFSRKFKQRFGCAPSEARQ